ncbi:MAG TPA: NGG1p interacting factor NIF3 [Moraxellaceae bacterium]|nr:NGG1p interacting factor NIF3 [Moraxellaceae bacterium]
MFKITFYVPESHLEIVKSALFAAGAGRLGDYDCCAWQIRGQGQFRPLQGSNPFIGQQGVVETVDEFRVELICADTHLAAAVAALRASHPYETPAFDVIRLEVL